MDLKQLKELRKQRKIKINELTKMTGISRNLIASIENGKGNPSFANVVRVIEVLDLELRILLK